jgi:hypothetical protein
MKFVFEVDDLDAAEEVRKVLSLAAACMEEKYPQESGIVKSVQDQVQEQIFRIDNNIYVDGQKVRVVKPTEDGEFDYEHLGKYGVVKWWDDDSGVYEVDLDGDGFTNQFFPYQLEKKRNA